MRRGISGSARPAIFSGVALALVVVLGAWGLVANATYQNATAQPGDLTVVQKDYTFGPDSLSAAAGTVSVYVFNDDDALHTFTSDELGVDVAIPAGKSARVTFTAKAGKYRFYCRPHAPDMDGTLSVQ